MQTSPDASGQVTFQVFGTHTYAEENAPGTLYQISVTINDKGSTRSFTPTGGVPTRLVDNPGASTTTPGPGQPGAAQAMVIDAPIIAQAAPIAAVEGKPLPVTTILATFIDTDPLGTTTDYTATVNWGDGTPTVSAMIAEPAGPGLPFDVSQAAILGHTYAEEGNYVTTIVISDVGRKQDDREWSGHRGRCAADFHRVADSANHPGGNTFQRGSRLVFGP